MACVITPVSAFQSTNLSNKIDSFNRLADRIVRSLGAPLVQIELHQDQLFESIMISCEMFTKYAGYTKEYLAFDSDLYTPNVGLRLDHLYTLANPTLTLDQKADGVTQAPETGYSFDLPNSVYVATSGIHSTSFALVSSLSSAFTEGVYQHQILDYSTYNQIVTSFANTQSTSSIPVSTYFVESHLPNQTRAGNVLTEAPSRVSNMFDYDLMEYRKIMAITEFEEGSTTGINTLFTIEQTMAQQTYFSYAMGNYGFDLVSWYAVKEWLEMREKLLSLKRSWMFDPRTQIMQIYPEPNSSTRFWGVVAAYVESPIRDVIKEQWVYQYALALSKIILAQVRGKYGNITMFGGQTFNATDIMTEGIKEKEKLETQLFEGAAAGFGDSDPCLFFVG